MVQTFYQRSSINKRGKNIIKIGTIDQFHEVLYACSEKTTERIGNLLFESFFDIKGTRNQKIFTAYKNISRPDILYILWEDFPYYNHAELGSDLVLQEIKNHGIKYLLIDNTYVKSGWLTENIGRYLDEVFYPGALELGLVGLSHIQAQSTLGSKSFEEFGKDIQLYLGVKASVMKRSSFKYIPVRSQEENRPRQVVLKEALVSLIGE
jgi:hypothetical protein